MERAPGFCQYYSPRLHAMLIIEGELPCLESEEPRCPGYGVQRRDSPSLGPAKRLGRPRIKSWQEANLHQS